jgi:polyhydroxybutyrate depolymerase
MSGTAASTPVPTLDGMVRRVSCVLLVAVAAAATLAACGTTETRSSTRCASRHVLPPGTTKHKTVSDGVQRFYSIHVPPEYDGRHRRPVILLFHGIGGKADIVLRATRMQELADKKDIVLVAPQGAGIIPSWNFHGTRDEPGSDVGFAHQVLDEVKKTACIDSRRAYAAGFSNGSALTLALACEDSHDFAAFGAVSAPFYLSRCDGAPPRSIIYFHGAADRVVPYAGARTIIGVLPGVDRALDDWATHDRCDRSAKTSAVSPHVTSERWTGCQSGSEVIAYRVDGGGHRWPGGVDVAASGRTDTEAATLQGVMTQEIDATSLMWAFFAARHR